ncbi:MAG TPA: UDP-N-acetylglucosamine 2-epimerase, partial [Candidatus Peribacteria bacterium]|nr:UDP-N-acetylglucosamine 2-epimerase [Candidatus Peribacteria bacterium]
PCITLRTTTERPETVDAGGNKLIFPDDPKLAEKARDFLETPIRWKPVYAVENTSDRILDHLLQSSR